MNGQPTKKQKDFQDWARNDQGCIVSGEEADTIHHIKGARMKLKGVKNAGEWYFLSLSYWEHQDGENPAAIHVNRKEFERVNKRTEKEFWVEMVGEYEHDFGHKPMSEEEYQIIVERA